MEKNTFFVGAIIVSIVLLTACSSPREKRAITLYKTHCASCHLLPAIEDLPKHVWEKGVLPDMAARMGITDSTNNPFEGLSFDEQYAIKKTRIYPNSPLLSLKDWKLLKNYILTMAPDSLPSHSTAPSPNELVQFVPRPVRFDSIKGTFISLLKYNTNNHTILTGDLKGNLLSYNPLNEKTERLEETGEMITDYTEKDSSVYLTHIGYLNPSEIAKGHITISHTDTIEELPFVLHRPVNTLVHDLNKDGRDELVVSEFGDFTGSLSLFKTKEQDYEKQVLLNRPGAIRSLVKDMDEDGKDDLVVLMAQAHESIVILYQKENLKFVADPVLRFSPVYGTSWFDLLDYDGDGDQDIVTASGDNADKSFVQKPYHGFRIYINDGENRFEEKYFYALNGATRLIARDFDKDGDIDFGLISAFPDYALKPDRSFVYLENKNSEKFVFKPYTFKDSKLGKWLLVDAGDIDKDGDEDIILSSFTYTFAPVPKEIFELWKTSGVDVMILENKLVDKKGDSR